MLWRLLGDGPNLKIRFGNGVWNEPRIDAGQSEPRTSGGRFDCALCCGDAVCGCSPRIRGKAQRFSRQFIVEPINLTRTKFARSRNTCRTNGGFKIRLPGVRGMGAFIFADGWNGTLAINSATIAKRKTVLT